MGSWMVGVLVASLQVGPGWVEAPVPDELATSETRSVEVDRSGAIWFGVSGRGLGRLSGDPSQHSTGADLRWVGENDGLMSTGIADLLEDRQGRLWAVGLGGYAVLEGGSWTARSRVGPLSPRVVFSAYQDPESGTVWLGTSSGAGGHDGDHWTVVRESDGLPHAVVHAVARGPAGALWFACRTGLARLHRGRMEVLYPGTNFRSILQDPGGTLWFGTSDGVFAWNGESWTRYLPGRTVYPRLVAGDGSVWAGSASAGAFRFDDAEWVPVPLPSRLQGAEVFDIAEAMDGSIWVATGAGVARLVRRVGGEGIEASGAPR